MSKKAALSEQEKQRVTVLKFGGSFATNPETGEISTDYFENFFRTFATALIERCTKIGLVIGGGPRVREDQRAAGNISSSNKDRLAKRQMLANAETIRQMAGDYRFNVVSRVPKNPEQAARLAHDPDHNTVSLSWLRVHQSSDASAAFLFQQFIDALAHTNNKEDLEPLLVILSNVPFIFDNDPYLYPEAKPISFSSLTGLVNKGIVSKDKKTFKPGMSVPIDPVAVDQLLKLEKHGLAPVVYYTDGRRRNFRSVREVLMGTKFNPSRPRQGTRLRHVANEEVVFYRQPKSTTR